MTNAVSNPRMTARVVLVIAISIVLAVIMLNNGGINAGLAFAQATPSPGGPTIQLLNPSGETGAEGPGTEISAKSDGVNSTYHLVAWVSSVPNDPLVEFKYQSGNNPEINIGQGSFVGSGTYELQWNLGTLADGAYTLKTILYSGGSEIARDEEPVRVNNNDNPGTPLPASEAQGETVEITYPTNPGNFGFFRKPGTTGPYSGVITVSHSADAEDIFVYYTTSGPGTEPAWVECGDETVAQAANGVRCTLEPDADPTGVTAVAAAAHDGGEPTQDNAVGSNGPDSGDAHRTNSYIQVPTSVTVSPSSQTKFDSDGAAAGHQFPCSDPIVATVLDQNGRPVAGANVDVHAQGPTDNLFFDDTDSSNDNSSAHQPPDANHTQYEGTVNCESTANPRPFTTSDAQRQGEHDQPGEGDPKHIESSATGTNDAGQWTFQLYNLSNTITGTTQFAAYYDRDDDDRFCSSEPAGNGSIGWGTAPASPTGIEAETTACPEPTVTPTPSESPSESPSGSPSPSPTGSPSPGDGTVKDGPCAGQQENSRSDRDGGGEIVVGTQGDDTLVGTDEDDIICGLGGDDTIDGAAGDDLITGDAGKDQIVAGEGDDEVHGGGGKDTINGGDGNDTLDGGNKNDNISGRAGNDRILGRGGFDTLKGNAGDDTMRGHSGNDILQGGGGSDHIKGRGGKDVIKGFNGADTLIGNAANDIIKGGAGPDTLRGGKGDDTLNGGAGQDTCRGGPGDNRLRRCE